MWMMAVIIGLSATLDVSAQFRRKDIYDAVYNGQRHRLRELIMQWLTVYPTTNPLNPIKQHLDIIVPLGSGGIHCNTATFLTWHRQYIDQLETWLMGQPDGPRFVPLPKWNPTTVIPGEFFNSAVPPGRAVVTGYTDLAIQNPNSIPGINIARFLSASTICDYAAGVRNRFCMGFGPYTSNGSALDNFAWDLERAHNAVHNNTGGVMAQGASPAAAIFFLWHAFVDDAYQHYLCNCTGSYPQKDLYIKDNDADIGDQPNTTTGVFYLSPEIWVRQNQDVFSGGRYSLQDNPNRHENAEYKISGNNYIYVRVRNKGCLPTVANEMRLRVYWSKAQTGGWTWPNDWTNTPPQIPKRGDEVTNPSVPVYVPVLQPGESWVAEVPWHAPNPADYPTDSYHFCLLARIVSTSDPMAVVEGTDVGANTRNNNNIAWKNVTVRNDDPFNIVAPDRHPWNTVHVRPTNEHATVRLQFDFPGDHGVHATVELRGELFERWREGGAQGRGVTLIGKNQLRIESPGAYIEGFRLNYDQIYTLGVNPYVEYDNEYQGKVLEYGDRVNFNVIQSEANADGTYGIVGGNNYEIRLVQSEETKCGEFIQDVRVTMPSCPDASDGSIRLSLPKGSYTYFWSTGARSESIDGLAPGSYWVVVRMNDKCIERREFILKDRSGLSTSISSEIPRCQLDNGSAAVSVQGGKPPYAYQWYRDGRLIDGATNPNLGNMGFGAYTVRVTDAAGCTITDAVHFDNDFMPISLWFDVTDASSPDAADGSIDMTVVNGMDPLRIQWSNGQTVEDPSNLPPGDYSVTVIDMMGCVANGTVTVGVAQNNNLQSGVSPDADLTVLSVVPNPVKDLAEIQYTLRYSTPVRVEVYDDLGRLATSYEQGVKPVGVNSAWIETSGLASGRYSCRLVFRGGVTAVPFVVVR